MQLNETTARIDGQLDSVCKKIEKIEHDTRADNEQGSLMFRPNYTGPGSKWLAAFKKSRLTLISYSSLLAVHSWIQVGQHEVLDETLSKRADYCYTEVDGPERWGDSQAHGGVQFDEDDDCCRNKERNWISLSPRLYRRYLH